MPHSAALLAIRFPTSREDPLIGTCQDPEFAGLRFPKNQWFNR
jgi:hypothetical protein